MGITINGLKVGGGSGSSGTSSGMSQATADSRYLKLSGGTLTGTLTLVSNPSSDMQAATKKYVDSAVSGVTSSGDSGWTPVNASETVRGITYLVNSVACTSTTNAATPAAVKAAYDLATLANTKACSAYELASTAYTKALSGSSSSSSSSDIEYVDGSGTATASGTNAFAAGAGAVASARSSIAIGDSVSASNSYASAIGRNVDVSGPYSVGIGVDVNAYGGNCIAIGHNASANALNKLTGSIAIGSSACANVERAVAIGDYSTATAYGAVAFGEYADVSGQDSIGVGPYTKVSGKNSAGLGYGATTANSNSIQLGSSTGISSITAKVAITVTSDERDKTDIEPINSASEFLRKVHAVTYVYNQRELYRPEESELTDEDQENLRKYGFCRYDKEAYEAGTKKGSRRRSGIIAQEAQQALKEVYGDEGYANLVNDNLYDLGDVPDDIESTLAMNYEGFIPFLIKGFQEQDERIAAQDKRIVQLEETIQRLLERSDE